MKHLVFFFYITSISLVFSQKTTVQHVEPPNWWTGMQHHELEVMIHGNEIAKLEVKSPDLKVLEVHRTENVNYVFITIETALLAPGTYHFQFYNGKKKVMEIPYELIERSVSSAQRKSFDATDVLYLLMPDRFSNGNESNDSDPTTYEKGNRSLPGGRHGGDIQGMIGHLDYIKELGATTIWPTPLLEDNDSTYSYHTYGQSNLYKVDPRYGTNSDYKQFVTEAHRRDLKVIQDMVPNHIGYMHWMMKDLPTYTWIHQFPGYAQSNYRMTSQMDPNGSKRDLTYCASGWFVPSMPDLNQSNPLVLNYLIQNALWWIEYANLDGFRVDTYSFNDKTGIAAWTKAITDEYPHFNIVGEVWMHDQAQISYWQSDSPIAKLQSYNSYLPSVMDFTLQDAFQQVFKESQPTWEKGTIRFYENFVNDFLYANPNNLLVFMENHDTHRFNEDFPDFKHYQMGLGLIMTIRGIPQIYYGSEIGMRGNKDKGDADIRHDFPGGWKNDSQNAFVSSGRNVAQNAYFNYTKQLLNWRKTAIAVHEGKTLQFLPENNVYVYFRIHEQQVVMVVMNNSDMEQTIDLSRFQEGISNFTTAKNVMSGENRSLLDQQWKIHATSLSIFELKSN
jgi:glycosidase